LTLYTGVRITWKGMVIDNMLLLENAAIRSMSDAVCEQYKTDILEGGILIKDGKILEVSPKIELPQSADCMKIDVNHHLVMPGIIEAHCHMGITGSPRRKKVGRVTTVMRQCNLSRQCSAQLMLSIRWMQLLLTQ